MPVVSPADDARHTVLERTLGSQRSSHHHRHVNVATQSPHRWFGGQKVAKAPTLWYVFASPFNQSYNSHLTRPQVSVIRPALLSSMAKPTQSRRKVVTNKSRQGSSEALCEPGLMACNVADLSGYEVGHSQKDVSLGIRLTV